MVQYSVRHGYRGPEKNLMVILKIMLQCEKSIK